MFTTLPFIAGPYNITVCILRKNTPIHFQWIYRLLCLEGVEKPRLFYAFCVCITDDF